MTLRYTRVTFSFVAAIFSATSVASAQSAPSPGPSKPPLTTSGYVRSFDFTRQNASDSNQGGATGAVNQQTMSTGIALHADYQFSTTWSVGAGYFFSDPLNGCANPTSHLRPPCGKVREPSLNPDDTIPGYTLSTLDEAYLQFKDPHLYTKLGNQIITTPWATAADTRIKPAAFQGLDVEITPSASWTFQAADMIRFEPRTSSQFDRATLLTSFPGGAPGVGSNIYVPGGTYLATNGFTYGRVGYASSLRSAWTANANYYAFADIANALWLDARVPLAGNLHPFLAAHFGSERNAGASKIGKIDATLFGIQAAASVMPNVVLSAGYDGIPVKSDRIALPTGYKCGPNNTIVGTANSANGVFLPYFLPSGGTGQCSSAGGGLTNIYYGGWASPYTDSYTADPLFTTSLTQGLVERRSPGNAVKATLTFTSTNKRLVAYISNARYDYNNGAYAEGTFETDLDAQYYFNKIPTTGPYKGFMFRYRYGTRTQSGNANIGGTPLFVNNRFQAYYNF